MQRRPSFVMESARARLYRSNRSQDVQFLQRIPKSIGASKSVDYGSKGRKITDIDLARVPRGFVKKVIFGGFSAESLSHRILDCKAKIVLSSSGVRRGSKVINLKEIIDNALRRVSNEGYTVETFLTYDNDVAVKRVETAWQEGRNVWWQDLGPAFSKECKVEWVDAQKILYLY